MHPDRRNSCSPPIRSSWLVGIGKRIFGHRLFVGLAVAAGGLELLDPTPFLANRYLLRQMLAILVIGLGLALRAWGAGCAGGHTRSGEIEAPRLATGGPFAYLRNPIYAGTMVLGFGMAALIGDPWAFVLAALAFALLYFSIVPAEEQFLTRQFGPEYARYRAAVPRLFPRLRAWSGRTEQSFLWPAARGELRIAFLLIGIYAALHLEEYLDAHWGF